MTNSKQAEWYIHHFYDYHEIENIGKYKAIELGCFPIKNQQYHRYFGLFYTGRKPAMDKVLEAVSEIVDFNHVLTNEDETTSDDIQKEVKTSIRLALKN